MRKEAYFKMRQYKNAVRRAAAWLMAACLMVQPALAADGIEIPADYESPFSDMGEGDWFYPYVASLNSQGIIAGYDDGRFGPHDPLSTGAALVMVIRAAGYEDIEAVEGGHYAAGYANYARERGWLDAGQLENLDGAISRLAVAQLAARALGLELDEEGTSPFADTQDSCAAALYQAGIVAGSEENGQLLFHPEASITRAEISVIVWQIQQYVSHIHFGSYTVDILENVPVNPYDPQNFVLEGDRMTYTGEGMETALGVDVSSYQGSVDWEKAAEDGIDFAMIRVGYRGYGQEGKLMEDTAFRDNLQGALDAGLEVGVYFFSQAITEEEAREEADFVLELIDGYDLTYPVVFDWENITYDTARTDGIDSQTLTALADAFCRRVEEAGYQPMIYFNQYLAYLMYDLEGITQWPFWLAEYNETPGFYYTFQMWQYTDAGQVDGIQGDVDLNLRLMPQA